MYNDVVIFERKIANQYGLVEAIMFHEISEKLRINEANKTQILINDRIYTQLHIDKFLHFISLEDVLKALEHLQTKQIIITLRNNEILLASFLNDGNTLPQKRKFKDLAK